MFFASLPSNIVASSSLSSGNQIFKPQMHVTTIISMFKKKKKKTSLQNTPAKFLFSLDRKLVTLKKENHNPYPYVHELKGDCAYITYKKSSFCHLLLRTSNFEMLKKLNNAWFAEIPCSRFDTSIRSMSFNMETKS